MSARAVIAMLCISLYAAHGLGAEHTAQPVPADAPAPSATRGSDPAAKADPPAEAKALESFKPTDKIPADSAVAFPVDI